MNLKGSKRYLTRIYLWVTIVTFCIVTVFSLVIYFNTERIVSDNEHQSNKKILYQSKYFIDYIDDTISSSCLSLFMHKSVQHILNTSAIDYAVLSSYINDINTFFALNSFIESAYIYNKYSDNYYSIRGEIMYDNDIRDYLSQFTIVPKLKPLLREISVYNTGNRDIVKNVLTYIMYDSAYSGNQMDSALIVNVDSNWLFNSIKMFSQMDEKKSDSVFIIDSSGKISGSSSDNEEIKKEVKNIYDKCRKQYNEKGVDMYFSKSKIGSMEYLISAVFIANSSLTLVKMQDYNEIFMHIRMLKTSILIIGLLFLLLTVIISYTLSTHLYKPVRKLVGMISSKQPGLDDDIRKRDDEFEYLNEVYSKSLEQVNEYKLNEKTNNNIVQEYFLKKLIIDSPSVSDDEFEKTIHEIPALAMLKGELIVCLLKVDNYPSLLRQYSYKDCKIFKYAIMNIFNELISEYIPFKPVDLGDDQIVLLFNANGLSDKFYHYIVPVMKHVQKSILEKYDMSISCFIDDRTCTYKNVTESYNEVLGNSKYRFIVGNGCVILPEDIKKNKECAKLGYSMINEKILKDSIRVGNLEKVEEYMSKIFAEIAEMNINNILLSTTNLVNALKNTYEEINSSRLVPFPVNFNFFGIDYIDKDTSSSLFSKLMSIIRHCYINDNENKAEKQAKLVDTIKDIIHSSFHDSSLCLQGIATMLQLNPLYIGRVFKNYTQLSVNEYINEVRLVKAAELLRSSRLSIQDISYEVGIDNPNYFYTLFKKKFGDTPKAYSMKSKLM